MAMQVFTGGWRGAMEENFCIAKATDGTSVVFSREERERHIYTVGKSGSGKSTFLFNLVMSDIYAGEGVVLIDPHGDLALDVLDAIPRSRINQVCYLDAGEGKRPVGFNPASRVAPERRALAAAGFVTAFKHLWHDSWGPRLEHFLFHGIAALIARPQATLLELPRLYTEHEFRGNVLRHVRDQETRRFWEVEYPSYPKHYRAEAAAPILNKAGQFAASTHLRRILGQRAPKFDLAFAMNNRRILIVNLAKGVIGEQAANLLGSLLVSHLQLVAMERSVLPQEQRVPFFAHIDEFQSLSSESFASLLSEARKFGTHFCLANQYTDQLSETIRAAVLGNAGTLLVFRVGCRDSELLAPEFRPMESGTLTDLGPFEAWLRRGYGRQRITTEPQLFPRVGASDVIRKQSAERFGRCL